MICKMFQDNCRFCSHEQRIIPYAPLIEKNGRLVPGLVEHRIEIIGGWCNNISQWVDKLNYCPARWGLHGIVRHYGIKADGCNEYPDTYGQSMIEKDDEFVIVGLGQQRLMV